MVSAPQAPTPRLDRYGDALPNGAQVRIGPGRSHPTGGSDTVRFTPDGQTLVLTGPDRVHLWDVRTGAAKGLLNLPLGGPACIELSPDGRTLAVCHGREIALCDLKGTPFGEPLKGHACPIRAMRFTFDGRQLITADGDEGNAGGTVITWDVGTRRELRRFRADDKRIRCLDVSPDGSTLATVGSDRAVRLWDAAKGTRLLERALAAELVHAVRFSPDGQTLATAAEAGASLWHVSSGKKKCELAGRKDRFQAVAISPDGRFVAVANRFDILLCDATSGELLKWFVGHRDMVTAIAFSPDGKALGSCAQDQMIRLWDVATRVGQDVGDGRCGVPMCASFTPDGKHVLVGTNRNAVFQREASSGALVRRWDFSEHDVRGPSAWPHQVVASPDGRMAAIASGGNVILLDLQDGKRLHKLDVSGVFVQFLAFTTNGKQLLAGGMGLDPGGGHGIFGYRWDVDTGEVLLDSSDFLGTMSSRPNDDGSGFVHLDRTSVLRLIDIEGRERLALEAPAAETYPALLSPDGRMLAIYGSRAAGYVTCPAESPFTALEVWEVASRSRCVRQWTAGASWPVFAPDGRTLVWADPKGGAWVLDVLTGRQSKRLGNGHQAPIRCLAFSPDGRRLLTAASDETILIWDASHLHGGTVSLKLNKHDELWSRLALAESDVDLARRAIEEMAAAPDVFVPFIGERIRMATKRDIGRFRQLLVELDSDDFETREQASAALANMTVAFEGDLRAAAYRSSSAEVRYRASRLLCDWPTGNPLPREPLRLVRAIEILERSATPDARKLLQELADGVPEARLTREAAAAIRRLEARK
jgi:WD40 repeat protein